jgi:hypothetical protein
MRLSPSVADTILNPVAWVENEAPSAHPEIRILEHRVIDDGLRLAMQNDGAAHQHISMRRNAECDRDVLFDQDATNSHLAADAIGRLMHALDYQRGEAERRLYW